MLASVLGIVKDGEGKVKAAMLESAAIVEDFRSQCIVGFLTEAGRTPTVLHPTDSLGPCIDSKDCFAIRDWADGHGPQGGERKADVCPPPEAS